LLLLLRRLYLLLRGRAGGCRGCPEEKKNNHCRGNSCP
jgi:hypothetical protein